LSKASVSFQAEFRQRFTNRFGGVAFAGTGWTGDDFGSLRDNGTRSAAGLGLRYRLSRKFPVDFAVDYSHNDQDEGLLYIYVGQRF
jgi:outer membrane translocation and assembly module TamA